MRYDSLPVHKQSVGRFPAHYTHYTGDHWPGGDQRWDLWHNTQRCPGIIHIRHKIIITMSRGRWCHYPPHWHGAILIRVIIIVVSVQIFAQDPITGIDFNVSHRNYRLISDLRVKWNCLWLLNSSQWWLRTLGIADAQSDNGSSFIMPCLELSWQQDLSNEAQLRSQYK